MTGKKGNYHNHQWTRIHNLPNLDTEIVGRTEANKTVLKSEHFKKACEASGAEATSRQASKYRRKRGLAFNFGK